MARLRGMAGLGFGVAVIAVAIWLGARQGSNQDERGFNDVTTQPVFTAPAFRSDQDDVRNLSNKDTFAHTCGTCHTLRAAGVKGVIGPDLDKSDRKLTFAVVREQIRTGSLDSSMPANLLTGKDADRVARYVARVAR